VREKIAAALQGLPQNEQIQQLVGSGGTDLVILIYYTKYFHYFELPYYSQLYLKIELFL